VRDAPERCSCHQVPTPTIDSCQHLNIYLVFGRGCCVQSASAAVDFAVDCPQGRIQKFISGCFLLAYPSISFLFLFFSPLSPFPCLSPLRIGPSNPAKAFGWTLLAGGEERHLQLRDISWAVKMYFGVFRAQSACKSCSISVKRDLKIEANVVASVYSMLRAVSY